MKQFWKRLLAGVLTVVMLAGIMPPPAYAAVRELAGRSAVENAALLEALRQVYGDDAEAYLAVLRQYGLVDEDGHFVTDEKIVMDGTEYTLDEITAILDSPDTDLAHVVEVDGTHLTLGELKTIVEIERYLAYIKATYFTPQDLTEEQIENFYSFADALANGRVQMLSARALSGVGPAGVDHGVRLSMTAKWSGWDYYIVTVTLNRAQTKDITFSCQASEGTISANMASVEVGGETKDLSDGGTVTIPAGETEAVLTVKTEKPDWYIKNGNSKGYFWVQLYDLKNALFSNGTDRWEEEVSWDIRRDFDLYAAKTVNLNYPGAYELLYWRYPNSDQSSQSWSGGTTFINDFMIPVQQQEIFLSSHFTSDFGDYEIKRNLTATAKQMKGNEQILPSDTGGANMNKYFSTFEDAWANSYTGVNTKHAENPINSTDLAIGVQGGEPHQYGPERLVCERFAGPSH